MRLPPNLARYGSGNHAALDATSDEALVKMGTLRSWMARIVRMIPSAGVTIGKWRGSDGDVWYLPQGSGGGGSHPFKVSQTGENLFTVQAGTCEGQLITTTEIDVGATRPVAILAYPKYTLGIDDGQFVNTIAVKTGLYAPVLVSSTSIFSDVDSGITSAGTEARVLIAYIDSGDSGDVISQIATGNIVGDFDDDGTLTGQAAGRYNKNF